MAFGQFARSAKHDFGRHSTTLTLSLAPRNENLPFRNLELCSNLSTR